LSALAQPGQQQGLKPTPQASARSPRPFSEWFRLFLYDELKPYPGRAMLVARYTAAATVTMLLIITFRIPGAAVGGFFSLLLSRESPVTTLKGGVSIIVAFLSGLVFLLVGAILLVDYPITHFLWVIGSFFVAFYGISAISNYGAATPFAIVIVLLVPLWDSPEPQDALITASLWTAGSVALAIVATIAVEFLFSLFVTDSQLVDGLNERLEAVRVLLLQLAHQNVQPEAKNKVSQFALIGVSRLRRLALTENSANYDTPQLSTIISLTGRLVDVLGAFRRYELLSAENAPRLQALADETGKLQSKMKSQSRETWESIPCPTEGPLILLSLEQTMDMLRMSVLREPVQSFSPDRDDPSRIPILKPDAFSNPEHLRFALRGCLASVLCYFIFNAVFWQGLNTSLFTCVVTALTSIGTSRQKQLLRASGAIVGGLILGMGSQVLILPLLDTVSGFTVLFVCVTAVAAWFMTASPRISYFGNQMALAFYLIQLRGPFPQTNLAIARDNVMGILLGLVMMWLAFETFGTKPAVQVMRELFAQNLQLMAQLARPWPEGKPADIEKISNLRSKISQNFAAVNSQADAVLFEVGRSRAQSLAIRERLLNWQPQLRSLFLLEIALLQYRLQVSPKDLPPAIVRAATRLDDEVCTLMDEMARAFLRQERPSQEVNAQPAYVELEHAINEGYGGQPPIRPRAVLAILSQIIELASRLRAEMNAVSLGKA
jgi:multidrug resistance protein MdtO